MPRPNILLFVPDGLRGQALAADSPVIAPHHRALAARGVRLNNAYTPLPTCSPARASLMTGLLPHNHGVLQVEHTVDDDQCVLRGDRPHFAQHLQQAGYETAFFGKWHIERSLELDRFGWQIAKPLGAQAHRRESEQGIAAPPSLGPCRYQTGPDGYNDTLHYGVTDEPTSARNVSRPTDAACAYLEQAPPDRPWCCVASYYEPNEALIVGRPAYDLYDLETLPLAGNIHDDLAGRPNIYRREQEIFAALSEAEWRQALACYYGRITEMDEQLGRLLAVLEATGQLANTIVIATSDHGRYLGSHGCESHNFGAFEEIYRIPMIAAGPGLAAGVDSDGRVGLHDLCPTILELAGAPPIAVPDSRSFAPLLRQPAACVDDYRTGYAEYHGTRFTMTQRIAWDGEWKFVFNGFDFDELYNLRDDPGELRNLAAAPEHAERRKQMMRQVWRRISDTGDRPLLNTHYYSMRLGVVGPNA